ncbi:SDR family NAD(P)-dependent oxidoreductase [Streptomyces armeniacus]|uniref:SDR family NAD(P)-dependent oxidoreductase n=1 Tax=Streptomyces armeniacus TaxID=83291 RepID=A0A345XZ03_9ACTN|nr:SDR family NAD(P)-dependent oxidoreductase [Streptomyces armeniacus]
MAFVFPGQGSQWPGMARALLTSSPVFAEEMERCAEALTPHTGWNLLDTLHGTPDAPSLDRVDVVQPALFAVMVSLAALWRSYGVEPDGVVGHSQGEIAAAFVAGALSLEDAARIVALRSREIATLGGTGGMLSVARPAAEVRTMLATAPGLSVAAVNGPSSVLVSGDREALEAFHEDCVAEDVWVRRIPVDYASHSPHIGALRERLTAVLAPVRPRSASVAFHSTVTGEETDTTRLDAGYWYTNLRSPVLFEETVRAMADQGYGCFVEVSPHAVLTAPLAQSLEPLGGDPVIVGSLTRDHGELGDFLASVAEAWEAGVPVDWSAASPVRNAPRVEVPGYAFVRQRFWVGGGDAEGAPGAGMKPARHPLLAGHMRLAGGMGHLFTGRVSTEALPWLADHTVFAEVVVPGTAVVELAASAGACLERPSVAELTLEAPLLVRDEAVGLQLHVQEPDDTGEAAFTLHAEDGAGGWTRHASGTLGPRSARTPNGPPEEAGSEVPEGAAPLSLSGLYDRLADRGMGYGRTFRGLRAAWRLGDGIHAEIALDDGGPEPDPRHLVHPALLDAAFHASFAERDDGDSDEALLPFAWSGVRLHGSERAPRSLRVRLTPLGQDTVRMTGWDEAGRVVVTVDSVTARPVSLATLAGTRPAAADCLFAVDWTPAGPTPAAVPADRMAVIGGPEPEFGDPAVRSCPGLASLAAPEEGAAEPPAWVLVPVRTPEGGTPAEAARTVTHQVLSLLRDWLAADRPPACRLALVTRGAVAARPGEGADPALAAVWGLVRSAQAEHPDSFALVDLGTESDASLLGGALALDEPQVALRDGTFLVPRAARRPARTDGRLCDPESTVLVTGGTGGLGSVVARHLAREHGVRHLLLASRRGMSADGAPALVEELTDLGVRVRVAECDVSDRDAVAALLASVPEEHPLGAVVHSAGVLEDSLITSLTGAALDRVLRAKADSAWHLHELTAGTAGTANTAESSLEAFVLFSSLAGVLGGPGQGNYAAANAFLDALAAARRAAGLPATSLAWGLWEQPGDMTGHLSESDTSRLAGSGVVALSAEEGLQLLDATLGTPEAVLLAARLDLAAVRTQTEAGMAPPPLRGLLRDAPSGGAPNAGATVEALAGMSAGDRENEVLRLVRGETAAVLRYPDADAVPPDRPLKDVGLDSLGAVQLRNRLNTATGLQLPATVIFDHPTPRTVASLVLRELFPSDDPPAHAGTGPEDHGGAFDPAAGIDDLDAEELVRLSLRGDRDDL